MPKNLSANFTADNFENYVGKFEEDIEHMVDTLSENEPSLSSGGVFGDGVFSLAKSPSEKDDVN